VYENGGVHSDYLRIIDLDQQALRLLRKYGIRACLIRRGTPLATLIGALPDWRQVYADDVSVIFVLPANRPQAPGAAVGSARRETNGLTQGQVFVGPKALAFFGS
jgi:hypothetical protein